jgi:gamma-glutamylcyclotransferase (GGCT)/AIG2-like uncharacterized protein YtfP
MEYLFSYGTLRRPEVQMELFGREVALSTDVMTGYRATPIKVNDDTHSLAIEHFGGEVEGSLLALSSEEIGICDEYEPAEYCRVRVDLLSGQSAWAYVAAKRNL